MYTSYSREVFNYFYFLLLVYNYKGIVSLTLIQILNGDAILEELRNG